MATLLSPATASFTGSFVVGQSNKPNPDETVIVDGNDGVIL